MLNFDGKEVQEEFNKAFGNLLVPKLEKASDGSEYLSISNVIPFSIEKLTLEQLWWLTKFAKHVRGRCRNNAAFNNYMNRTFPSAIFQTIPKEYNGKTYQGLKITVNGETMEGENNE